MHPASGPFGLLMVCGRDTVVDKPAEDISDPRKPGFQRIVAGHDPALDRAADAAPRIGAVAQSGLYARGADNQHHLSRLGDPAAREPGMRVDDARPDRRTGQKPQLFRPGRVQLPDPAAHRTDILTEFVLRIGLQPGIERLQKRPVGVSLPFQPHRLVPGGASGAAAGAGQQEGQPVGRLQNLVGALVDFRILPQDLERLWEGQFGGNLAAIAREVDFPARGEQRIDLIRFRLGGMVLP